MPQSPFSAPESKFSFALLVFTLNSTPGDPVNGISGSSKSTPLNVEFFLPAKRLQAEKVTMSHDGTYSASRMVTQSASPTVMMSRTKSLERSTSPLVISPSQLSTSTCNTHTMTCMGNESEGISVIKQESTVETAICSTHTSVEPPVYRFMVAPTETEASDRCPHSLYIVQQQVGNLMSKVFGIRMYASCTDNSGPLLYIKIHHDSTAPTVLNMKPSLISKMPHQWFEIKLKPSPTALQEESLAKALDCVSGSYQQQLEKWGLKQGDKDVLDCALDKIGNGDLVLYTDGPHSLMKKPWIDFKPSVEEWERSGKWNEFKSRAYRKKMDKKKNTTRKRRLEESD